MTLISRPCPVCASQSFVSVYPATDGAVTSDAAPYFSSSRTKAGHLEVVRCTSCTMLMTNPGDDDATLGRTYAGLQDQRYDAEDANRSAVAQAHLRFVQKHVATGRLLDLGCATGTFVRAATEAGWHATGLDASSWSLARARERCPSAEFRQGLIEDAVFPDGGFDVITMWDTLEHVPDPAAVFARVRPWLKPGGWLFLNLPNSDSLVARALGRHWVLLLREHLWYFSPTTIAALLARVGFRCEATQPNVVRFSLANVGVRLGQYPGRVPKLVGQLANASWSRRVSLPFPIGEMTVAARRE